MENTRVLKTVRESNGSLLVTLTSELKLIDAVVGEKVTVAADAHSIRITKVAP
jgi:hypothetical protein